MSPRCLVEKSGMPKFVGVLRTPQPQPGGLSSVIAGQTQKWVWWAAACWQASRNTVCFWCWLQWREGKPFSAAHYTQWSLCPENFPNSTKWKQLKMYTKAHRLAALSSCEVAHCSHLFCCDFLFVLGAKQKSSLQPLLLPHQKCFCPLRVTRVRFCSQHTVLTLSLISVMLMDLKRNLLC